MVKRFIVDNRDIVIGGIGKMFYQEGFPISMAISHFREKNIEVSMLHIADECLKHGWSPETTIKKLKGDFEDDIDGNTYDTQTLERFCYSTYEEQREMIFQYLFGTPSNDFVNGDSKMDLCFSPIVEMKTDNKLTLELIGFKTNKK